MRKMQVAAMALLLALALCACAAPVEVLPEEQMQTNFINNGDSSSIAELDGAYYVIGGNACSYLCRLDPDTGRSVVVCNKPDCLHDRETDGRKVRGCNGFIQNTNYTLARHGDRLYAYVGALTGGPTDEKNRIVEIMPDGTGQRTVLELDRFVTSWAVHRGYLYVAVTDFVTPGRTYAPEDLTAVYRYRLQDPLHTAETVYEVRGVYTQIQDLQLSGEDLYFSEIRVIDESTLDTQRRILGVNTRKLESRVVCENSAGNFALLPDGLATSVPLEDGSYRLVLLDRTGNTRLTWEHPAQASLNLFADAQYLYVDNQRETFLDESGSIRRTLTVMDLNGKVLNQIPIEPDALPFKGASERYVFYISRIPEAYQAHQGYVSYPLMVLKKDELLSADAQGERFYIYTAETPFPGIVIEG